MSHFHARTLDLLPRRPTVSKAAAESVVRLERRIAMPLPASLREWYSYETASEILETYSPVRSSMSSFVRSSTSPRTA